VNNIKVERARLNMSKKDLAEAIDVSAYSVALWEKDINPCSARNLAKMCELFGVTMDYLVGRSEARK